MRKKLKIRFLEDALLVDSKILVIGDLHIGYEEYVLGKSLFIRTQLKEMIKKLDRIFLFLNKEKIKVTEVVILGDLKHEFGTISESEWRETMKLLDYLLKKTKNIKLIRGNHDSILGPIAEKKGIKILDYYKIDNISGKICFLHGDVVYKGSLDSNILIIGHLHPAVILHDKYKKEKYKCFLRGKMNSRKKEGKKEVYVIPSFMPLTWGYDINKIKHEKKRKNNFSIIDEKSLKGFEVIIFNEKNKIEHNFGKWKDVTSFLPQNVCFLLKSYSNFSFT